MTAPVYVTVLIAVIAAAVGVVAGLALGRWRARGVRETRLRQGPTVAELLARLVRHSHSGLVVVNRFGDVVLANERAEALGAVVGARPEGRVAAAAALVSDGVGPTEIDLSPEPSSRRAQRSVIARIRPLGDGFVVVDASDTSDAVRLEAVRRDFVANVGHELKTPVGAMGVLAEAVLDADDPAEVHHFAEKILRESRRLGSLVTELIELSRLQGAERLHEPVPTDVDEVLEASVARVRLSAEAAGTEVALDDASGIVAAGSRTLLITALTNLLENAVAYSPPGSSVSVRRRRVGAQVEISVTDRGIGIAAEHRERVFERFFRVDPARSRATGGTGLGLAIVKHVAANHGGDVRLWSEPGVGSTFTLRVPAVPAATDTGPRPPAVAPPAGVPPAVVPSAGAPSAGVPSAGVPSTTAVPAVAPPAVAPSVGSSSVSAPTAAPAADRGRPRTGDRPVTGGVR